MGSFLLVREVGPPVARPFAHIAHAGAPCRRIGSLSVRIGSLSVRIVISRSGEARTPGRLVELLEGPCMFVCRGPLQQGACQGRYRPKLPATQQGSSRTRSARARNVRNRRRTSLAIVGSDVWNDSTTRSRLWANLGVGSPRSRACSLTHSTSSHEAPCSLHTRRAHVPSRNSANF
jgi:hypothetical protein